MTGEWPLTRIVAPFKVQTLVEDAYQKPVLGTHRWHGSGDLNLAIWKDSLGENRFPRAIFCFFAECIRGVMPLFRQVISHYEIESYSSGRNQPVIFQANRKFLTVQLNLISDSYPWALRASPKTLVNKFDKTNRSSPLVAGRCGKIMSVLRASVNLAESPDGGNHIKECRDCNHGRENQCPAVMGFGVGKMFVHESLEPRWLGGLLPSVSVSFSASVLFLLSFSIFPKEAEGVFFGASGVGLSL
jgi:hypothetical protein